MSPIRIRGAHWPRGCSGRRPLAGSPRPGLPLAAPRVPARDWPCPGGSRPDSARPRGAERRFQHRGRRTAIGTGTGPGAGPGTGSGDRTGTWRGSRDRDQGPGNGSREQGAGTRDRDQDQGPGTRTRGSRRAPAAGRGSTAAPMWPGGPSGPPCAPRVLPAAAGTGSARAGRGQPLPSPSRARLLGGRPRDPLGWPGAGGESRAFVHPSDSPRKGGAQTAASPPECHLPPRRWGMSGERNPPSHRSRSLHLPLTLGKAEMRRGLC